MVKYYIRDKCQLFIANIFLCLFIVPDIGECLKMASASDKGKIVPDTRKQYPCYQDIHLYIEPVQYSTITLRRSPRLKKETLPKQPYVALVLRKLLISKEHAIAFTSSLKSEVFAVNQPDVSTLWYKCVLCTQLHTVKIIMYQA